MLRLSRIALFTLIAIFLLVVVVSEKPAPLANAVTLAQPVQWVASPIWTGPFEGPTDSSGDRWYESDFDESSWTPVTLPDQVAGPLCSNGSNCFDRFYRVTFQLPSPPAFYPVWFASNDGIWIYVNGDPLLPTSHWGGAHRQKGCVNVPVCAPAQFRNAVDPKNIADQLTTGTNTIAVMVSDGHQGSYFDFEWVPSLDPLDATRDGNYPTPKTQDPVNTANGAFTHSHTDMLIAARGLPLEFTRYYHSGATVNRSLGFGWTHNYDMYLEFPAGGINVFYPDGHAVSFALTGGVYVPRAGVHDALVQNGNGTYTFTTPGQMHYTFSASGALSTITDRNNNTTTLSHTGNKLTTVTDASLSRTLTFAYENSSYPNYITKVTDPLSRTVEFTYDANGDLTRVKDVKGDPTNGPFTVYAYQSHRMSSLSDANGHQAVQNFYDAAGRVTEQRDATGGKTCIYYGITPKNDADTCPDLALSVTPYGAVTVIVDPRGAKTTHRFDDFFRVIEMEDSLVGKTRFAFNSDHHASCVTDQRGKKTAYSYDATGNVRQMIDAANTDANCQLKAGGKFWTYEYTATNDIKKEIEPAIAPATGRRETEYIYDSIGNLTRIVRRDADGLVKALTCFERDTSGQPNGWGQVTASVQSTDLVVPGSPTGPCTGNRTLFGYDSFGNQTCAVNARFSATTTCASATGPKMTSIYDAGGRVVFSTNEITNSQRPPAGNPETGVSQCGPLGTGDGENDDSGEDTATDDGCPSTAYTYDPHNNVLTAVDGLGNTTMNTYDAKGTPKTVRDANHKLTTYNYDNGDRLIEVIDALNQKTSDGYDANGNRTSVTDPKRQLVGPAESGAQCNLSGQNNGTGNDIDEDVDGTKDDGCPTMKYAYDALNRLQSSTDALGRVTSYQYDAASNLNQRTDARGLITKYVPDDLNRVDLVEHRNADNTLVDTVDYTYDEVSNRKTMVDSTGTTNYAYDALNRLTCHGPNTIGGSCPTGNVGNTYDDIPGGPAAEYPGQRTKITYPDNKTVNYTYEPDGRMKSVTDWLSKQTVYNYDDAGRLATTVYPNTMCSAYAHDSADRLTSVVNRRMAAPPTCAPGDTTVSIFTYTPDAVGNRTQMVDSGGPHDYVYDDVYRLTQVTYPGPQIDTYTYDPNGNRQTKNGANYTYNAADQMVTDKDGVSYGYDNNGNQTSRGNDTFTYDHENRLTKIVFGGYEPSPDCYDIAPEPYTDGSVTGADISVIAGKIGTAEGFYGDIAPQPNPDGVVTGADLSAVSGQSGKVCPSRFIYNGDGLRVTHTGAYLNWRYVWDVAAGLPVILKENDSHNQRDGHSTDNTYVYGLDLISVTDRVGAQSYYLYDGLGSVTGVTDGSGNASATLTYDVFGEIRSGSGIESEFRFTGEQRDSQSGRNFYYLRARYYDPGIGRFLSQDPLPFPNRYSYVGNNPVRYVDPYGLWGPDLTPDFVDDFIDDTLGAGQDAFGAVVVNLSDIATVVAYVDAVTGPITPVWFEVASAVLTEVAILIGDCDWGTKAGLSLLNLENLAIGLIGQAGITFGTAAVTLAAGPVAGGAYAVTVYILVAGAEIGLTTGSLVISENEPSCKE